MKRLTRFPRAEMNAARTCVLGVPLGAQNIHSAGTWTIVRESMHGQNAKQHGFALCSCLWSHTYPCVLYVLEVENILMCDKMNREIFVLLAGIAKFQTRYLHKLCKDSRGSSSMFVPFPLSAHKQ